MSSYQARFKEWLASGTLGSSLVTVVKFFNQYAGVYYINDYGTTLEVNIDGQYVATRFVSFAFNLPKVSNSTKQELTITMDNTSGIPYSMLKSIPNDSRFSAPLQVELHFYLDDDLDSPQLDPPLKLEVVNATAEGSTVQFNCAAPFLRKSFTGMLYKARLFPTLYSFWT